MSCGEPFRSGIHRRVLTRSVTPCFGTLALPWRLNCCTCSTYRIALAPSLPLGELQLLSRSRRLWTASSTDPSLHSRQERALGPFTAACLPSSGAKEFGTVCQHSYLVFLPARRWSSFWIWGVHSKWNLLPQSSPSWRQKGFVAFYAAVSCSTSRGAPRQTVFKAFENGIPRGGILSPLLFNLLVKKLLSLQVSPQVQVLSYADDIAQPRS